MSSSEFVRTYPPAQPPDGPAYWLVFRDSELILREIDGQLSFLTERDLARFDLDTEHVYLGLLDGVPCLAAELKAETDIPSDYAAVNLRALYGRVNDTEYSIAGYASQMLYWKRTSRFCPVCGTPSVDSDHDWGRKCPHCGHVAYPRISPAVLILVQDSGKILLAQKPGWGKRYSILAGFVEPGETLEECVERETMEEVGLRVTDLVYAGSQTWPFPHQLMVGFQANLVSGSITLDQLELENAAWFSRDNLPELPPPVSLSRKMIDSWTARQEAG